MTECFHETQGQLWKLFKPQFLAAKKVRNVHKRTSERKGVTTRDYPYDIKSAISQQS